MQLSGLRPKHSSHPLYLDVTLDWMDRIISYRKHLTRAAVKLMSCNRQSDVYRVVRKSKTADGKFVNC